MSKDGGPAFPVPSNTLLMLPDKTLLAGMSLRDYFAAYVIQGLYVGAAATLATLNDTQLSDSLNAASKVAYMQADAMLAERAK